MGAATSVRLGLNVTETDVDMMLLPEDMGTSTVTSTDVVAVESAFELAVLCPKSPSAV